VTAVPLFSSPRARRYDLVVIPDIDAIGIEVRQTVGDDTETIASVKADDITRYLPTINAALRDSGHKPTVLAATRRKPIPLAEAAGVRLALGIHAAAPLPRSNRAHAVLNGISAMSDEETYYWHAKSSQPESGARALRALRILLADDHRTGVTA